ncbi:MAG: ferric reductase-like transmembrane domain-containing protein [Rhodospirillaceae bacterium]|nr:ferric reductase-like transmembrane domain-containing protein [Rhodospirillaceae bacterium]
MYPWLDRSGQLSWLKMSVFIGILLPGVWAAFTWAFGQPNLSPAPSPLGNVVGGTNAIPVTAALHLIGLWSIRFLLITLSITPLRRIGSWPRLVMLRRMIGVAAFAYVAIHFILYIVQQNYRLVFVASEILLRIYLTIGFVALLGLLVLSLTSTDSAMRRLGGKKWQRLHYLVYPLTMLGLAHFFMQSKINVSEPVLMSGLFLWLMLYRLAYRWNSERALSLWQLGGLAVASAGLTLLGEAAWYEFATSIGGERIWKATFDWRHIRPAWWILLASGALIPLKFAADRLWNQRKAGQKVRHLAAKAV